jgi:hypothetical protein
MAHDEAARKAARKAYVNDRLALPVIALSLGVSEPTLRRWKRSAAERGDDWDKARAANLVAGDGFDGLMSLVLEDFATQFQATMELLKGDDIPALDRVKAMSSLADAMQKTVSAAKAATPRISELGVAYDVLKRLSEFAARHHAAQAPAILEVLEPFADHLTEIYSGR